MLLLILPLQLLTQLMQLRKESLKKSGLPGFEPWPLRYRCSALTNWANKPAGSWSLNWFVIYPGKMKMKLWIYEIQIFELRNEEINVKKILAVINATYAVAKRKPEKISSQLACWLNWLERCTGIAEVRVRIPASLTIFFSGFLFATA